jgi:hypothetical protein
MKNNPEPIINKCGTKTWFLDGKRHREDGPAIETPSGTKYWLLNGKCHRVDGPAIIFFNGDKEWWVNGKEYSYEDWFQTLTSEQQYNYLWNLDE